MLKINKDFKPVEDEPSVVLDNSLLEENVINLIQKIPDNDIKLREKLWKSFKLC